MIEAVNAVLANAPLLRGNTEQTNAVRAAAAARASDIDSVSAGPKAPYISPYIFLDVNFDKAVLQIRDSDTGDVVRQFPSESTLEARSRAESARQAAESANSDINVSDSSFGETGIAVQETVSAPSSPLSGQAQVAAAALNAGAQTAQSVAGTFSTVA